MSEGNEGGELPGSRSATGSRPRPDTGDRVRDPGAQVYQAAREFFELATQILTTKMSRELRDQFERCTLSILSNIAEGAGKMSRPEKQRFYEIARGSTTEAAAQLDVLRMRGNVDAKRHAEARNLLFRVAPMLSVMCRGPRST